MPMPRKTKTITFSLPPEMAAVVEEIRKDEGRTTSELIREALRHYAQEREWRRAARFAGQRGVERAVQDGRSL